MFFKRRNRIYEKLSLLVFCSFEPFIYRLKYFESEKQNKNNDKTGKQVKLLSSVPCIRIAEFSSGCDDHWDTISVYFVCLQQSVFVNQQRRFNIQISTRLFLDFRAVIWTMDFRFEEVLMSVFSEDTSYATGKIVIIQMLTALCMRWRHACKKIKSSSERHLSNPAVQDLWWCL